MSVGIAASARAAELKVLSAGAFVGIAAAILQSFQSSTGMTVTLRNDTVGALVRRISGGEAFDVVLMSPAGLDELAKTGAIVSESMTTLARVGIGVGVKAGAPKPDVSTVAAFKATLAKARAVAFVDPESGGSSGIYLVKLFRTLGIADAMAAKSVLVEGGLAARAVLDDRADLVLQQISEIVTVPGIALVGPLPAEIQHETVYAGAIATAPDAPDAARGFLATLASPGARPLLAAHGMLPP